MKRLFPRLAERAAWKSRDLWPFRPHSSIKPAYISSLNSVLGSLIKQFCIFFYITPTMFSRQKKKKQKNFSIVIFLRFCWTTGHPWVRRGWSLCIWCYWTGQPTSWGNCSYHHLHGISAQSGCAGPASHGEHRWLSLQILALLEGVPVCSLAIKTPSVFDHFELLSDCAPSHVMTIYFHVAYIKLNWVNEGLTWWA